MDNEKIKKIHIECEKWRIFATTMRHYQTFGMAIALSGLIIYLLTDSFFFKIFTILGALLSLVILFIFSFYIDPKWKKAIDTYTNEVVNQQNADRKEEFTKKQ